MGSVNITINRRLANFRSYETAKRGIATAGWNTTTSGSSAKSAGLRGEDADERCGDSSRLNFACCATEA